MRKARNQDFNRLWIARKKAGLGQKTVARFLGHRSTSAVSEYETGKLHPNLRTALKLAVIYATPVAELSAPLFKKVEREVESVRSANPRCISRVKVGAGHWHAESANKLSI